MGAPVGSPESRGALGSGSLGPGSRGRKGHSGWKGLSLLSSGQVSSVFLGLEFCLPIEGAFFALVQLGRIWFLAFTVGATET